LVVNCVPISELVWDEIDSRPGLDKLADCLPMLEQAFASWQQAGAAANSDARDAAQRLARKFEDPIELPDDRKLATLREAGENIAALPPSEARKDHWQLAMRCLIDAADRNGIRDVGADCAGAGVEPEVSAAPVSPGVPRTESPFQKRATSFHVELGYPEKRDDHKNHFLNG
jgi:hypothetical protein